MKLRSISILTMSLGLFHAASAAAQTEPKPDVDQAKSQQPRVEPDRDQHPLGVFPSILAETLNQPRVARWRTVNPNGIESKPYTVVWSDDVRTSGITLAGPDGALRAHLKLPSDQGLLVTGLNPHSAEGQSGIQVNDVLLKLGETPLRKPEDFEKSLKSAGEKPITVHLLRAGNPTTVEIQPLIRVTFRGVPPKPQERPYWIGIAVSPVDPALRSQLQLSDGQGLIVNEVVKESPAAKAEIKVNDILLEIDGKPVSDSVNLSDVVQSHEEKPMVLHFIREGTRHWSVMVTPERRKTADLVVTPTELYNAVILNHPGAVLSSPINDRNLQIGSDLLVFDSPNETLRLLPSNPADRKPTPAAGAEISKRLDAIDATIQQLRRSIEELSRTTKDKK